MTMTNGKKLFKDTIIYAIANFGSKLLIFLMLPLYTHYFTSAEYGTWDLLWTTVSLIVPFITFELVAAVYRWLLEEEQPQERGRIITTGTLTILRNLLIFNATALAVMLFVDFPYHWELLLLINFTVTSSFLQQCARGLGFNKLFAMLGIIQTAFSIGFILIFIYVFDLRLLSFFYSSILAAASVTIIAWWILKFHRYIEWKGYSKSLLKSFLTYSIPIIPGALSWWILTMSDRYVILAFLHLDANGIYAVANKIPALLLMVNTIFFLAWKDSAITSFHSKEKDAYYSIVFKHYVRLMITTAILIILVAKPAMEIVIADTFGESWKYVGIMLIGALFSSLSQFWGAGFHGAKKTNSLFLTSLMGALLNILLNLALVPFIGLYGIAASTLLAFLCMWLFRVTASHKYFTIRIQWRELVPLFALLFVSLILPFILEDKALFISIAIAGMLFLFVNRELIGLLYRTGIAFFHKQNAE
ncbi:hypothetical protein OBCHQ24_16275 [Oceanobacillus iheyensis]|nr:hypothetical protein OBCHQ24_16275 [Oceanobacillus iheyensis]